MINAVPQIMSAVRGNAANSLMLTSDSAGALPFFAQLLPENGLDTEAVRIMGLTRWDTPPQTLELSGLQGSWFCGSRSAGRRRLNARFEAAYGTPPHILGALGYDAIRAVGETARPRAGSARRILPQALASMARTGYSGCSPMARTSARWPSPK